MTSQRFYKAMGEDLDPKSVVKLRNLAQRGVNSWEPLVKNASTGNRYSRPACVDSAAYYSRRHAMIKSLLKHPVQYVFAAAGIILVFLSMFTIQDITRLQTDFVAPIHIPPLIAGVGFILLSLLWYAAPHLSVPLYWTALTKIKSTPEGFETTIAHARVEVCFGLIESIYGQVPQCLVALPANDLFDDECINDGRSALGAFVKNVFPNQVHEICRMVQEQASGLPAQQPKRVSRGRRRYGVGTPLYFDQPLGKPIKMAFLAVTTVTEEVGIRCVAAHVFTAVKGLHRLMNEQRLDSVVLPILGSGHGGLRAPVSLVCMLIAFAECLREPAGCHIKHVRIVVFQKGNREKPAISRWQVRRLVAFAAEHC